METVTKSRGASFLKSKAYNITKEIENYAIYYRGSGLASLERSCETQMNQYLVKALIKILVKSLALTAIVSVIIGIIGYLNQWNSLLAYSNAFFLAGCLVIVAGTSSRLAAGQEWSAFQLIQTESFRHMSNSERANFIVEASSSLSALILGILSGLWLVLISALAAFM